MRKKDLQHFFLPSTGQNDTPTLHISPETGGVSALPTVEPSAQPDEPLRVHFTTGKFMKKT